MDVTSQWTSVWLRRRVIGAVALAVALVVGLVLGLRSTPVTVELSARVSGALTAGTDPATAASYGADTVIGLATETDVQAEAARRSGLPIDAAGAAADVTVRRGTVAGFVTIAAKAATVDAAERLARATAEALDARLGEDADAAAALAGDRIDRQLDDVGRQLAAADDGSLQQRVLRTRYEQLAAALTDLRTAPTLALIVADRATQPAPPPVPLPLQYGGAAFLVALILAGEAVVIHRAARGLLSEHDPSAQVRWAAGTPTVLVTSPTDAVPALAVLARSWLPLDRVTVVQLTRRDRVVDVGGLLAGGFGVLGHPTAAVRVLSVRTPEVDAATLDALAGSAGTVVLAVQTATTSARSLATAAARLRAAGADLVAVVVWRGRFPTEAPEPAAGAPSLTERPAATERPPSADRPA